MSRILRIDASSRTIGSQTRAMADHFLHTWISHHPADDLMVRDLAKNPLPHVSEKAIGAFYTPPDQQDRAMKEAVALSDELVAEFLGADILVLTVPMYNFSIPSSLKAYIDHIVRVGRTFGMDEKKRFFGLAGGKRAYVFVAYGAVGYRDGALTGMNFVQGYLELLLGFLGIGDISFISVEGASTDPSELAWTRTLAFEEIRRIAS